MSANRLVTGECSPAKRCGCEPLRRAAWLAVLLLVAGEISAGAQEHPNVARGFGRSGADVLGIDAINPFNGNLTLSMALGSYPVGPQLSFQLTLYYNSQVWEVLNDGNGVTTAVPARSDNSGLGWRLSLGQLFQPGWSEVADSNRWIYVAPDGSRHTFYDTLHDGEGTVQNRGYTRDGSYLRLNSAARSVEFPNGIKHTFDAQGNLIEMVDPFGNWIRAAYSPSAQSPQTWTITDIHDRTYSVYFKPTGAPYQQWVLDRVELPAFNGGTSTTWFRHSSDGGVGPISQGVCGSRPVVESVAVVFLVGIEQLATDQTVLARYSVPLEDYYREPPPTPNDQLTQACRSGRIARLTMPTLGKIEWDYGLYNFPSPSTPRPAWQRSTGVVRRSLLNPNGTASGNPWTYSPTLSGSRTELANTMTEPSGTETRSYFSVCSGSPISQCAVSDQLYEYGLPLTRDRPGDGTGRFLSSEVISGGSVLRTHYVRYERDEFASAPASDDRTRLNQRQASMRLVYNDDSGRFADTDLSDFDGLGHYRTVQTNGNFGTGDVRSSYTRFNPGSGSYPGSFTLPTGSRWIVDTFDQQDQTEGGATARRTFLVDSNTGWVSRARIHRCGVAQSGCPSPGAESTQDIVIEASHVLGFPAIESYYGGDTQALGTASLANLSLPQPPQYRIDSTSQYGTRATATYVNGNGQPLSFKSLDQTIDPSTALPISSRDTSGIATAYEYDSLGRLRFAKPESGHDGWTEYVYTPATSASALAQVQVLTRPNGGGAPLAERIVKLDAFGRIWREQQKMPDGTYSTRETLYDVMGWKTSVSELGSLTSITSYSYDAFGRPTIIHPPDLPANNSAHEISFSYSGARSVARKVKVGTSYGGGTVNEANAWTTEFYDRQGRLFQVKEEADTGSTNTTTTYFYDVGSRIVRVKQETSAGTQNRYFAYDQRGFLLSEQHPEKGGTNGNGFVFYESYDPKGHALRRYDCAAASCVQTPSQRSAQLTFEYDRAERLKTITEVAGNRPLKTFSYGTSNASGIRSNGKLETATRYNYVGSPFNATAQVAESYTYGGRQGRVSQKNTLLVFNGTNRETFVQSYSYNALGRVSHIDYPVCTFLTSCPTTVPRGVDFAYTNGLLTSIPGFATSIAYWPNGLYKQIAHSNGVVDALGNDPKGMARPALLSAAAAGTTLWSSGTYAYDGAGNVVKMGGSYFLYDHVSRVVDGHVYNGATGGGTLRSQTYTYDPFGNLTAIGGDLGAGGRATPTAPLTNRLSGGTFDVAGSMTAWNGNSYEYDALGMMTRFVAGAEDWRYIYTAADERFWMYGASGTGGSIWTLRDLDGKVLRQFDAHISWNTVRDYVYRDGQLLASSYPGEGDRHVSLDHLGTPRLATSSAGGTGGVWTGSAANCIPAPADYDGDGNADFSLKCGPVWYFYNDNGTYLKGIWTGGPDSDVPVPADYDGDGDDDVVAFNGGAWQFYDYATGAYHGVWTGSAANCIPAPADYDGDGNADFSLKCGPAWHFYNDNGTYIKGIWTGGQDSDVPVPADYDGDGDDDVVAFNGGAWLFYDYATGAFHGVWTGVNGTPQPAPMDYDGDGTADFTVYANGAWHFFRDDGSYFQGIWTGGVAGDLPVPENYRGDRTEEPVIFRNGAWEFFSLAGLPVSYHAYFPFGEEITSPTQDAERMKFTGHERDFANPSSVGDDLDYMHARHFGPLVGRFLSVDQVVGSPGQPQSWNRYNYVVNRPLSFTDPRGLQQQPPPVGMTLDDLGGYYGISITVTAVAVRLQPYPGNSFSIMNPTGSMFSVYDLVRWLTGDLPGDMAAHRASVEDLSRTPAMDNIRKKYAKSGCVDGSYSGDFQYSEVASTHNVTGQLAGGFFADVRSIGEGQILIMASNTWGLESATRFPGTGNRSNASVEQMIFGGAPLQYPKSLLENRASSGPMANATMHYNWTEPSPCIP